VRREPTGRPNVAAASVPRVQRDVLGGGEVHGHTPSRTMIGLTLQPEARRPIAQRMPSARNVAGGFARRRACAYARQLIVVLTGVVIALVAVVLVPLPFAAKLALIAALYGVIFAVDRWGGRRLDRRVRGASSEEKVGALLDVVEGWHVLHDVDLGRGNVDHLVVGPGGIFAIETKSWRGYFDPDRFDWGWWRQAYRQAKTVERMIERRVQPIVVVCGAHTKHAVTGRRGVTVLPERLIAGHLERKPTFHDAGEVAAMLAHTEAALACVPRSR